MKGYQGIFFDSTISVWLSALELNPLEEVVTDMHITFNFGELDMYPDELMQMEVEVQLIGYGCDGKNSGFEVKLPEEIEQRFYKGNKPIHITVSIGTVNGEKGKPVDTAKLMFQPLEKPISIKGKFGYFVFGGIGKKMDNSIFNN